MVARDDEDPLTRRRVVGTGLTTIMGLTWVLISQISGAQASRGAGGQRTLAEGGNTPTALGSRASGGESGSQAIQTPAGQSRTVYTPDDRTPAGEPHPPRIRLLNLISGWEQAGDVEANAVQEISKGEPAIIGYRYEAWCHSGDLRCTIYSDAAEANQRHVIDRDMETSGSVIREGYTEFATDDWRPGTEEAEVVIRDEITGYVSEPASMRFTVSR